MHGAHGSSADDRAHVRPALLLSAVSSRRGVLGRRCGELLVLVVECGWRDMVVDCSFSCVVDVVAGLWCQQNPADPLAILSLS